MDWYWLAIGILWFVSGACIGTASTAYWFRSEKPIVLTEVQKDLWDDEFMAGGFDETAAASMRGRFEYVGPVDHDGDADTRNEFFPGHQPHPFCKHTRSVYP